MSTINEDVSAIKTIQDGLVNNKVARFSYTQKAYIDNIVDGVDTYNVNNEQNIPNGTAEIMKVNDTIINKGYRAQASSITRMLMNHFLGRISYNLNKVNDNMKSLIDSLNSHLGKKNGIATLDANAKLPQTQLPDISPDLSRAREIILAESKGSSINLITWNAEFDCWILEVQVVGVPKSIYLSINGNTDYTPRFYLQTVVVNGAPNYIYNPVFRCPYFVKKGTSITFKELSPAGSYIVVAPCMYVNA